MARTSAKIVACLSKSEYQRVSHGSGLTGSGLTVCSPVYSPWPDHRTRVNARGVGYPSKLVRAAGFKTDTAFKHYSGRDHDRVQRSSRRFGFFTLQMNTQTSTKSNFLQFSTELEVRLLFVLQHEFSEMLALVQHRALVDLEHVLCNCNSELHSFFLRISLL